MSNVKNTTVTIPIEEYERMQKIIKEKDDIEIKFSVVLSRNDYPKDIPIYTWNTLEVVKCGTSIDVDELYDKIEVTKVAIKQLEETNARINRDYVETKYELNKIKESWWYKMFN